MKLWAGGYENQDDKSGGPDTLIPDTALRFNRLVSVSSYVAENKLRVYLVWLKSTGVRDLMGFKNSVECTLFACYLVSVTQALDIFLMAPITILLQFHII